MFVNVMAPPALTSPLENNGIINKRIIKNDRLVLKKKTTDV
jgi:hypothetical protein